MWDGAKNEKPGSTRVDKTPYKGHLVEVDRRHRVLQEVQDVRIQVGEIELVIELLLMRLEICLGNCSLEGPHDGQVATACRMNRQCLFGVPRFFQSKR